MSHRLIIRPDIELPRSHFLSSDRDLGDPDAECLGAITQLAASQKIVGLLCALVVTPVMLKRIHGLILTPRVTALKMCLMRATMGVRERYSHQRSRLK